MPLQVFCVANYQTTGFTEFVPKGYTKSYDTDNLRTSNVEYVRAGQAFANPGQWKGAIRGLIAYPFSEFTLKDGTSTRDIVLFAFKVSALVSHRRRPDSHACTAA